MSSTTTIVPGGLPADMNAPAVTAGGQPRRWSRQVAADIVALADTLAIIAGAMLPVWIYATYGGLAANWPLTIQSAIAASIIAHLLLKSWGMYDVRQMHDFPEHPGRLFAGLIVALVTVVGLGLPFAIKEVHIWVWYATWASASYTLLLANRSVARLLLRKFTLAGRFDQRVAVYGAGQIARRAHDHLSDPELGIHFVGVFDDRIGEDRINPEGLHVAGKLDELIALGRNEGVDQIIVALPQAAEGRIAMIARKLEQLPVSLHIVTHIASDLVDTTVNHKVSNLGSIGLLDVKKKPLSDWGPLVKAIEDKVLGALLMLIAAPFIPLIALLIKLDSPGPVFFVQRRRGLNKQEIEVLKFRTMHVMEDGADVRQATPDDERVTRVGWFLRRFSMDELPQLLNVMRGEMSLVGPRPHAILHDDQFGESLETYANRHQVKPGITGLAQVKGSRGQTDTPEKVAERVAYDTEYIKNWSLWLDLKILAMTAWVVITGRNAY